MATPVLMGVYDDPGTLAALEYWSRLPDPHGRDPTAALDTLRQLRQGGEQVALVLADQWLAGMTGVEFLRQAHELNPTAKRVLFILLARASRHALTSSVIC